MSQQTAGWLFFLSYQFMDTEWYTQLFQEIMIDKETGIKRTRETVRDKYMWDGTRKCKASKKSKKKGKHGVHLELFPRANGY